MIWEGNAMIHSVTLTGKSQAKGRNGYFALSHSTLWEVASDEEHPFHLDFCSKRSGGVGPARLQLTREDAESLRGFLNRNLRETGKIENGQLLCQCGVHGLPALSEDGMMVSHDLVCLDGNHVIARGWDGSSSGVSEDGEALLLECRSCWRQYRLPENLEIEWR
jgi:hypothetical protein